MVAPAGISIREAALLKGISLDSPCAGTGKCGKCRVKLDSEKTLRLACGTFPEKDTVVHIPGTATGHSGTKKASMLPDCLIKTGLKPSVFRKTVRLPLPSIKNPVSDSENLKRALGGRHSSINFNLECLRELPQAIRKSGYRVTATVDRNELIAVEPAGTSVKNYGLAFDLGTTSVCGALVDLSTGRVLATASQANAQLIYGDDVISRITHSINHLRGLKELGEKAVFTINSVIAKLIKEAGIAKKNIYSMALVGNPTMIHLLLGIPPDAIAFSPYIPALNCSVTVKAGELGLEMHPCSNLYVFPGLGGYVGGDTVALILAARLNKPGKTSLAIDLGTNGEVALSRGGKIFAASTAAGPAFEGGHIKHGMRAVSGAIETVILKNGEVFLRAIDDRPPAGLCGSGLVDAAAELLREKIISETGYLKPAAELKTLFSRRIIEGKSGRAFKLTAGKQPITITQKDIREFQLAKGAIRACIRILLKEAGVRQGELDEILIAGTFGNNLRKESLAGVKMIPALPAEKITFIGNAAMAGAVLGLLNEGLRKEAELLAKTAVYVELSDRKDFQEEFAGSLSF